MSVYVHTKVENEIEAARATQELLDAGFPSRDIDVIERRGAHVHHAKLRAGSRVFMGAGIGSALGAILGSLAFTQPGLWFTDTPQLSISAAAGVGALFGLLGGGLTGLGQLRAAPKFEVHPTAIAVGVHTEQPRVQRAAEALKRLGSREVVASTERDAVERLAAA